jgi:hypothetical protein
MFIGPDGKQSRTELVEWPAVPEETSQSWVRELIQTEN